MGGSGFDTPAVPAWVLKAVIVAWSSFAVAAVAAMLFFAAFDPAILAEAATFPFDLSRSAGYTLGFFLFWILTAAGSVMTVFLMRSLQLHPRIHSRTPGDTPDRKKEDSDGTVSPSRDRQ